MGESLVGRLRYKVAIVDIDGDEYGCAPVMREAAAEIERLRGALMGIQEVCSNRRHDCTMLTSNPPQNAVAYEIRWKCDRALKPAGGCVPGSGFTSPETDHAACGGMEGER